jgi:hypothetical protein
MKSTPNSRIAHDPAVIRLYVEIVEGRRVVAFGSDSSTLLYWLQASGNPAYIRIFLRFSPVAQPRPSAEMALYTLARHAPSDPAAFRRLADIATRADDTEDRTQAVLQLTRVNNERARALGPLQPRVQASR